MTEKETIKDILEKSDKAEWIEDVVESLEKAYRAVVMIEEKKDDGSITYYYLDGFKQQYEIDGFIRQIHSEIMNDED